MSVLVGAGWPMPRPWRFTAGRESRYPLHRRLGGPRGRSGCVRKISPPPGFESRTMQPVVSREYWLRYPSCPSLFLYWKLSSLYTVHQLPLPSPGGGGLGEEVLMYKNPNFQQPAIRQPTSLCKTTNWMFAPISLWMLPSVAPLQHEKTCVCCHLFKALQICYYTLRMQKVYFTEGNTAVDLWAKIKLKKTQF